MMKTESEPKAGKLKKNMVILICVAVVLAVLLLIFRKDLSWITNLLSKGTVADLITLIRSWGIFAPLLSILLMLFQAVLFPIPSFLVTGANGAVFGLLWGTVISWSGAMLGAWFTFMLSRWFGESFVRKMVKNEGLWNKVDEIGSRYGFSVVIVSRLLPFVSFDFISYAAGLSSMRILPFLAATGIGMLPGTIAYVFLGNQLTQFNTISYIMGGAILLAMVIYTLIKQIKKYKSKRNTKLEVQADEQKNSK
ncbi:MAG: TVP38/TMEM64 family protein [Bacillota bacterium]|nr:TVP38/TMEM64 family protein [Bacillota bacterium]